MKPSEVAVLTDVPNLFDLLQGHTPKGVGPCVGDDDIINSPGLSVGPCVEDDGVPNTFALGPCVGDDSEPG